MYPVCAMTLTRKMRPWGYMSYILVYTFLYFVLSGFSPTNAQGTSVFTNLPMTNNAAVQENSAIGTSVFQVFYNDAESGTLTFSKTSSPTDGDTYFGIDATTGLVSTIVEPIDFETMATHYTLTIMANNGTVTTTADLQVELLDVNEPLAFTQSAYGTTAAEGQAAGVVIMNPGIDVTDPDNGETFICLLDCAAGNTDFTMATNCTLTFSRVYSMDAGDTSPVVCTVNGVDNGGNTATTLLTITITDVNNYDPQFTLPTYSSVASIYDVIGTTYTTVAATDNDAGTYGDVVYTLDMTAYTVPYFQVDATSGVVTLANDLTSCGCTGTTITVPAVATDTGGRTGTATIYVSVLATTTATTTTTTDSYLVFIDDTSNRAWLAAIIVLIAIVLGIALIVCYKYIPDWPKDFWRNASQANYDRNVSGETHVEQVHELDEKPNHPQGRQEPDTAAQTHGYSVIDEHEQAPLEKGTVYSVARHPPPHRSLQAWRRM